MSGLTGIGNYPAGVTDNDPHFDGRQEDESDPCEICGKPVYGWVEEYCCSGRYCGCLGKPATPCWCRDCWQRWDEDRKIRVTEFAAQGGFTDIKETK